MSAIKRIQRIARVNVEHGKVYTVNLEYEINPEKTVIIPTGGADYFTIDEVTTSTIKCTNRNGTATLSLNLQVIEYN